VTIPAPVLLLRHGQTTWNAERRWQGWADAPLSELGERQAVDAAAHLVAGGFGFTQVCCSDLGRARRTAELLRDGLALATEVVTDAGLRERDVGEFSGRLTADLILEYPDCFDPESRRAVRIPGAEEPEALVDRMVAAVRGLVDRFPDERLLLVSHGGVIAALERSLGLVRDAPVPNLGGRWLTVLADGSVEGGEEYTPVEPELVTEPGSE
jgi:2,3-bisphosphoglycerate-dependent phosphoglycerate mutase